jgi:LAGLIDADG endonuclease
LEKIKNTLDIGKIRIKVNTTRVEYIVESFKELPVIIEHFNNYPLVTAKSSDYKLFKQCFEIITKKEHLNQEGLEKIISLKSSLNWGLSEKLKEAFPKNNASPRPEFKYKSIPDPFWVSGFTTGDGSFNIVTRSSKNKIGFRVELNYSILLHIREKEVIIGLADFFSIKFPKTSEDKNSDIKYKYIFISSKSV